MQVVGLYYRPQIVQEAAQNLKGGERFLLVREPTNPHDPNAIKVMLDGIHLGYVPATETQFFEDQDFPVVGVFKEHTFTEKGVLRLEFELE